MPLLQRWDFVAKIYILGKGKIPIGLTTLWVGKGAVGKKWV